MSPLSRKILLGSALLLFILAAPLIILYAIGYRSGSELATSQVGVILLDTLPQRATVMVDDQIVGQTPRAISRPGGTTTRVRVELAGYQPWEKTVTVEAAQAIDFQHIRLFPTMSAQDIIQANVTQFSLAPNRQLIATLDQTGQLQVIDTGGQAVTAALPLPFVPTNLLWAPDSARLLLRDNTRTAVLAVAADQPQLQLLPSLFGVVEAVWDPRLPGRLFAMRGDGSLITYALATDGLTRLASGITSFSPSSDAIFALTEEGELQQFSLLGQLQDTMPLDFTAAGEQILVTPAGKMAVRTIDDQLYLHVNEEWELIHNQALHAGWSPDGELLYVQTASNELAVYNQDDERRRHVPLGQLHLVLRLSRTIRHPQWFAGGNHLLYQVDDEVVISGIDTRDYTVSTTLVETNTGDAQTAVGEDGDSLFVLRNSNGTTNLMRVALTIQ